MAERINERMTVRLPEETLLRMDTFIEAMGFRNRSEFVRVAVEEYMGRRKFSPLFSSPAEDEKIQIELPYNAIMTMRYLAERKHAHIEMMYGHFSEMITEWLYEFLEKYAKKTLDDVETFVREIQKSGEKSAKLVRE